MTDRISSATVTTPGERGLHIERTLNASLDQVWEAYNEPKLISQWWGRGNTVDIETWEPEPGGHWRFVEHHAGGTSGFEGRFAEIAPKHRVVRSFEWDGLPAHVCLETLSLTDLGDGRTKVVMDTLFMTAEDRDGMVQSGMEEGMNASFAALDALLARTS